MFKRHNGSAVPRHQVFVLGSGAYVVQWTENSVQDVMSGEYRSYRLSDFGHRISDFDLDRLKTAGVIEDYDHAYVWIYALPEQSRFGGLRTQQATRTRAYYINTTLPLEQLEQVNSRFETLGLSEDFCACEHERLVAVLGRGEQTFNSLKDAENAQRKLQAQLPDLLQNAAIAFTEGEASVAPDTDEDEQIDLDALIASQTDTSITEGKCAVVACKDDGEREAISKVLETMKMHVVRVSTAQEALNRLEEEPVDVLVMDVRFDDMHGWAMLGKVREIGHAERTRVIALAEPEGGEQVFALTVAKVDVYLRRPISMARLRQSVWSALKEHSVG